MHKLTIFTPTYNRAKLLPRLYDSLMNQSCLDFEWLIVDDGSTDNTKELVEHWIFENKINIRYFRQENRGKYVAHNLGVINCVTDYFVCLDSDDWLTENAVEVILNALLQNQSTEIAGLIAYKKILNIAGKRFPSNMTFTSLNKLYQAGFKGDASLIIRTSVLRDYLFPESKEKFFPEQYVYDLIDQHYTLFLLRETVMICEYQNDGYTSNIHGVLKNSPNNYIQTLNQRLEFDDCIKEKCKDTIRYIAISMASHKKKYILESKYLYLTILLLPFGWLFKKLKYDRK